jgi:hypothetical protein
MAGREALKELTKKYYDLRYPEAYTGAVRLLKEAKKQNIPRKKVENWFLAQDAYVSHKPVIRKFKRRFYYTTRDLELWQCDLCDMRSLSQKNSGYNYLLTCIDLFSKMAYVRPLKTKQSSHVIEAFKDIFKQAKPNTINTDKGTEFTAKKVRDFFDSQNIKYYVTQDPTVKAAVVERFNRTLKDRMWRYFTHTNTPRYIDKLQNFVDSYNSTYPRSIGMKPVEVSEDNLYEVWKNLFGDKNLTSKKPTKYKTGDYVLVAKEKGTFDKGYEPGWREEIFQIKRVMRSDPETYRIEDLKGEEITGSFYKQELQKILPDFKKEFMIERVVKKRGRGKSKEILVKWRGYPDKFNSWLRESDIRWI